MPLKLFVTYGVGFVGVAFNFTSNLYILSLDIMSRYSRIYIGRLPYQAREKDVERFFRGFGRIRDINLKNGFGFVVSLSLKSFICLDLIFTTQNHTLLLIRAPSLLFWV